MAQIIKSPSIVKAAGNKVKCIEEYVGRVNSGNAEVSIARMISPGGWKEPGQCPLFDEYTVVLKGTLVAKMKTTEYQITQGQGILVSKNEWVKYSTPFSEGAEYIAVCMPAFSTNLARRED